MAPVEEFPAGIYAHVLGLERVGVEYSLSNWTRIRCRR